MGNCGQPSGSGGELPLNENESAYGSDRDVCDLANDYKNWGKTAGTGCDGWGEPAGFCENYAADEDKAEPNWLTAFPDWCQWQVFQLAGDVYTWWTEAKDPVLLDGGKIRASVTDVSGGTAIVVVALWTGGVMVACIRLAIRRDGTPAKDMVKSGLLVVGASGFAVPAADLLVRLSRSFSDSYVVRILGAPGETTGDASTVLKRSTVGMLDAVDSGSGFSLKEILAGIVLVFISFVLYIYMVARYFLILYWVGTMPLMAAAASLGESGRQAFRQQIIRMVIWILLPDFMMVIFVLGHQEIVANAQETGAGTGGPDQWRGLILMALVTLVGPATLRAAAPFMSPAAGSSGTNFAAVRAGMAVGAVSLAGAAYVARRAAPHVISGAGNSLRAVRAGAAETARAISVGTGGRPATGAAGGQGSPDRPEGPGSDPRDGGSGPTGGGGAPGPNTDDPAGTGGGSADLDNGVEPGPDGAGRGADGSLPGSVDSPNGGAGGGAVPPVHERWAPPESLTRLDRRTVDQQFPNQPVGFGARAVDFIHKDIAAGPNSYPGGPDASSATARARDAAQAALGASPASPATATLMPTVLNYADRLSQGQIRRPASLADVVREEANGSLGEYLDRLADGPPGSRTVQPPN
ncbi:hypothetical protein GCM10023205_71100 [Yinghuangia aomiensis]|uniref:TrbL/VirB6 plasmid conjugal transfer protein n=2 Tax=Yinghuangia aomiensis TaxID=676205 RepID=A0ABP9I7D2_9ACTN